MTCSSLWARRSGLFGLGLAAAIASVSAQELRVTSWSLLPNSVGTNAPAGTTNGIRMPAAATALRKLNPDIILLQQVTDWAMCQDLAEALKPEAYSVVTCSALRDARGVLRTQQAAILAKPTVKPYFSWSDAWRNRVAPTLPGGYAFAAFKAGPHRIGVFSLQAAAPTAAAAGKKKKTAPKQASAATTAERLTATMEHLVAQASFVSGWVTNRLEALLVGGTFGAVADEDRALHEEALQLLHEAGFADVFDSVPAAQRTTVRGRADGAVADYLLAQPGDCTQNPAIQRLQVSRRFPLTCDIRLDALDLALAPIQPPKRLAAANRNPAAKPPAAAPAAPSASNAPTTAAVMPTQPDTTSTTPTPGAPTKAPAGSQLLWITSAGLGLPVLAAAALILARRKRPTLPRSPALLSASADTLSGYTVVMGTRSAAESAAAPPGPVVAQPVIHIETTGDTQTQTEALRRRALVAEQQAERAHAIIRAGLIPDLRNWLKQKLARRLLTDRAQMIETQHAAAHQTAAVEQRLARIERQIHQQNQAYVNRIEELTHELLAAKEENRELIRARIEQVKAEMAAARERLLSQE